MPKQTPPSATTVSIEAVIFDCDGTVVDSESPGLDVLHKFAEAHGLRITRDEFHRDFRGVRFEQVVDWIAGEALEIRQGGRAGFVREIRRAQSERFDQGLDPMPGATELLGSLNVPFCVATNGPREKVEKVLATAGLRSLFADRVFCAPEVGSYKPDPALFIHAAEALNAAPDRCAVVEDSVPGVAAGVAAGMQVFTLHPPEGMPPQLAGQVRFVADLIELTQLFGELGLLKQVRA